MDDQDREPQGSGDQPGGRPPNWPEPIPDHQPRRWPPSFVGVLLALILAVTLAGVFAIQARDADNRARELRAQVEDQERALEQLRGRIRSSGEGPLGRIVAAVETLRGLTFKREVEPLLLSTGHFADRVREEALQGLDEEELEGSQRVLTALGVLAPGTDLRTLLIEVQEEQVAGFYDTDERQLVARAGDAKDPSPFDRVVLAHEYVHALTDQHFDLRRLDQLIDDRQDDAAAAYRALVEGDATLLMRIYQEQILTAEEQRAFAQEAFGIERGSFDALPRFLQEVLEFPYTRGLDFVSQLHRRGGFDLVDRAYEDPPASTEQILHPEKYLDARDDPQEVKLPNLRRALGEGWSVLERGVMGELDLRIIADEHLSVIDARAAADGWDGGSYVGLGKGKGTLVAVSTVWDSVNEAREAATLFGRWLPLRFGNKGSTLEAEGGRGWTSDDGAGLVVRDGERVHLVIGPDESSARTALRAL